MHNLISVISSLVQSKNDSTKNILFDLIRIIYMVRINNSLNGKRILFESFCIKIKKILDIYINELNNNIHFSEVNKIRNILAHDVIFYSTNLNGITIADFAMENELIHNKYYFDKDGAINYIKFMTYYTLLFCKEITFYLHEGDIQDINVKDIEVLDGLNIIKEYNFEFDDLHDEYIRIIHKIHKKIKPENIGLDNEYIENNLKAIEWFEKNDKLNYKIDYMHTHISLGINLNDDNEALKYLEKSLQLIDEIKTEYKSVTNYRIYILNKLSTIYYSQKDKDKSFNYSKKCMEILNTDFINFVSIYNQLMFNLTFSNALSIYEPAKEKKQLEKCIELLLHAEEKNLPNLDEFKFNIYRNYLSSYNQFKFKLNDKYLQLILLFEKCPIKKEKKHELHLEMIKYYYLNSFFDESYKLAQIISKKSFLEIADREYWKYEKEILKFIIDKNKTAEEVLELKNKIINNNKLKDNYKNHLLQKLDSIKYLISK